VLDYIEDRYYLHADDIIKICYANLLLTEGRIMESLDYYEQGLAIAEALARSGAVEIIIIDSVAALVPRSEIEGEMGDSHVGQHARLMSQALRKLAGIIAKTNCIIIFINQLREKIGVMYGNPETTTGGRALKFYASMRIDVRRIEQIKVAGRNTQGVRVIRLEGRQTIASIAIVPHEEEVDDEEILDQSQDPQVEENSNENEDEEPVVFTE
jgi:protein RecA